MAGELIFIENYYFFFVDNSPFIVVKRKGCSAEVVEVVSQSYAGYYQTDK